MTFCHLHVHTEYSLVDGTIRVAGLVERARALGMPAVAVTDQGNLFAMVKFYKAAIAAGIKPIIGADLWVAAQRNAPPARLVLLCQDATGYRNLSALITRSYLEGQRDGRPCVAEEWLDAHAEGLIALCGGPGGPVARAAAEGRLDSARAELERWLRRYPGRFCLQVQRTGRPAEERWVHAARELATELGVPLVATNDVRFLTASDFEAHEARVCIQQGRALDDPRRPREYSEQQYLRSPEEMQALFADMPEALANTAAVARRCNLELDLGRYHLPEFPLPPGTSAEEQLREQAAAGLARRLGATEPCAPEADYRARLDAELEVITGMGFAGYYLIVADFIGWARDNGIPVGPGRGSGAGSLVAWALGITDLDPLRYDLLFERFLNPERVSMPDFDIDFCMERRDEVIDYVARRYGRERVSQIITHGTMAARAVVRDVGRVLGHPYGFVDQVAKLIPFELDMTLERALEEEPALRARYEAEEEVRVLLDLARRLEGLARNAGRHAGGVVIAPRPLREFMPLYCEPGGGNPVTQLDMGDVEAMGLVKFDFLGLRTLTIIDWALRDVNAMRRAAGQEPVDIARIPLDDPDTFALIRSAATSAVFQLESRGMRELIRRLQPDSFDDLVALVALFRPGPLQSGMVDDFIDRKHGRARVEYPHPALEPILRPTYGVILYQEQVMQIAQTLAGYSLGGADLLRRAMGKKKPEEMARQREVFLTGATERGVDAAVASRIFDLMEKFAGYGFNKSHSAAYALIAYQTAWLKAHHPAAFMAAVLSADMDNTDKVVRLIEECRSLGLSVEPPHVNLCAYAFTVADERTIRYGLGAIKGVGESAVTAIVSERERGGAFADLDDLCQRVDLRRANRRVLETLVRAGALDGLGPSRRAMAEDLERALAVAEQRLRDRAVGQDDLFGVHALPSAPGPSGGRVAEEWPELTRLAAEKETLGLYLTGHPITRFEGELARLAPGRLAELRPGRCRVAGWLVAMRTHRTRRGRLGFATLDDRSARVEVTIPPRLLEAHPELAATEGVIVVEGQCSIDELSGELAVTADGLWTLEQARVEFARRVELSVAGPAADEALVERLAAVVRRHPGRCPVVVDYRRDGARARLRLGDEWLLLPTAEALAALGQCVGAENVRVEYTA